MCKICGACHRPFTKEVAERWEEVEKFSGSGNTIRMACFSCPYVEKIQDISLRQLWCINCPCLTVIENLPKLKFLYCSECPVVQLAKFPKIERLVCMKCPQLQRILVSSPSSLVENCPILTYAPEYGLRYENCSWLNPPEEQEQDRENYAKQIQKLVECQRIAKRYLQRRQDGIRKQSHFPREIWNVILSY